MSLVYSSFKGDVDTGIQLPFKFVFHDEDAKRWHSEQASYRQDGKAPEVNYQGTIDGEEAALSLRADDPNQPKNE